MKEIKRISRWQKQKHQSEYLLLHKTNKILPEVINETKRQRTHKERGFSAEIILLNFSLALWSWFVYLGLEIRGLTSLLWRPEACSTGPKSGDVGPGGGPCCGVPNGPGKRHGHRTHCWQGREHALGDTARPGTKQIIWPFPSHVCKRRGCPWGTVVPAVVFQMLLTTG